jgi:hypothetical protein
MIPGPRVLLLFNSPPRHDYHLLASVRHIGACFKHFLYCYRSCEHWHEVEDGKKNKDMACEFVPTHRCDVYVD